MNYDEILVDLKKNIPKDEYKNIMTQYECELDDSFLGFIDVYSSVLNFVPKHFTIIDLGCNLAAQSYLFKDYQKYIGVDSCNLKRFKSDNAEHFYCSIEDFINNHIKDLDLKNTFAICSYVPDEKAIKMARNAFVNILVYYPSSPTEYKYGR